ncbi:unnamed protein product [Ceutorhynchus assimilis]|uniref:Cytokine receptor-like factor 3 n=1 Tax=Ceutorhynchus assimilis TaxID=467358 RepID=A0A9N9QRT2_9CUCU|nr:unnamed protein product [Ceutorhynchus assimilis]
MNRDNYEISETLKLAKLYIENLNSLKTEIHCVEKQIATTYSETEQNIKETFSNLKEVLRKTLERREKKLLEKAEKVKNEGVLPLKQCEQVIEKNIQHTLKLIDEGSQITDKDQSRIINFLEKAGILGNLPEVPESKEVPYISFYHEPTVGNELENLCLNFGEVFRTAPIQINTVSPKPGALLIQWQQSYENNDDRVKDIQEFKLQRAFGDVIKEKKLAVNFIDCYTGTDFQYLQRDIQISQTYSFRVCCKFDGTTEWSPWSVPQVGATDTPWFSWMSTDKVILSNENKIVTSKEVGVLVFSDGPQVSLTDSVEFSIIEVDPKSEMMVALCIEDPKGHKNLKDMSEIFMVSSNGRISVAGVEKSTVLASFSRGLKVGFSLEPINPVKVRVHVDCKEKRVTYDWSIKENSKLYFACQMMSSMWKVMVE